jgi:peptidoglycan pentaglycine glycine transferase (the first glycine)
MGRASGADPAVRTAGGLFRKVRQADPAYTVREVNDATPCGWDGWLREWPGDGHVLQSYAWGEFKRQLGWRLLRLVLERGGEAAGVGQFLLHNTLPITGVLMYCSKGPWLPWEDEGPSGPSLRPRPPSPGARARTPPRDRTRSPRRQLGRQGPAGPHRFPRARYALNSDTTVTVDLSPPRRGCS